MTPEKKANATGIAITIAGFVVIVLGWYGAARQDHTPSQIPYVLSGGLLGVGLIMAGLTLLVVLHARRDRMMLAAKLDELARVVRRTDDVAQPSEAADVGGSIVVVGRTAYHKATCHLLEGKADLRTMTARAAAHQGLSPCRICAPGSVEAAS